MKNLAIVEIWWRDAEADNGWENVDDSIGVMCPLVRTVGLLLEKTSEVVLICHTHSEDETNGRFRIPAAWIEFFNVIKQAETEEFSVYQSKEPCLVGEEG